MSLRVEHGGLYAADLSPGWGTEADNAVFRLRPYQPSARRLYQPAALPERPPFWSSLETVCWTEDHATTNGVGTFSTSVKIRSACMPREMQLDPAALGFCCTSR